MAGKIFINYRRDDSIGTAGRLHDRLAQAFGRKNVFMDVDHIPAGVDFVRHLNDQVATCELFLAVIGPDWLDAKDDDGQRRLDKPEDFVRVEIAAALARDIRVIPVLIDDARMPKVGELPEPLKPLVRRNAVEVRNAQFGRDADALIRKVREAIKPKRREIGRWPFAAGAAAALLLAGWIGLYASGAPVWVPWATGQVGPGPGVEAAAEARRKAEEAEQKRLAAAKAEDDRKRNEAAAAEAKRKAEEAEQKKLADAAEAKRKAEEEARREPALAVTPGSGQSFRDSLADGQPCPMCPEMIVVPAGSFMMGSPEGEKGRDKDEGPTRDVTIAKPFAVGKFAVTRGEFAVFVADTGHKAEGGCYSWDGKDWTLQSSASWNSPGFAQDDRHPVVCVNWDDAKAYSAWLARKTGKPYRLLTEAEREYATRARKPTPFWWGSSIATDQANYDGNDTYGSGTKGEYRAKTVPVGSFQANPFGLYQVHGNVWEWTEDCYHDSYKNAPSDGSAWIVGECGRRVVRGGSWSNRPPSLRSAARDWCPADDRDFSLGFRVARTLLTP